MGPTKIKDTLNRMKSAMDSGGAERDQFDGKVPMKWFVDNMQCASYDELLQMFDSAGHNAEWSKLWSDRMSRFLDKMVESRSSSYLDAGHRNLYAHYMDNEVESSSRANHYNGNWLLMKDELDELFTRKPKQMKEDMHA